MTKTPRWLRFDEEEWTRLDSERRRRGYRQINDFLLHLVDLGYRESVRIPSTPVVEEPK